MLTRIQCYECGGFYTIEVEDVFSPCLDSWICKDCADELKLCDENDAVACDPDDSEYA